MTAFIGRREFITLLGGAAAWPLAARAQQTAMPVVGFLRNTFAAPFAHLVTELGKGLSEEGFVEGRNVIIEQRWGDNQPDRLPGLAADLVRRRAAVIVGNTPAVLAAVRVAGPTVPLVFVVGDDPVKSGLVASLNRPEGNLTGVTFFGGSLLGAKRLALLQELVPKTSVVAVLLDPDAAFEIELVETAARALDLQIVPVKLASSGTSTRPSIASWRRARARYCSAGARCSGASSIKSSPWRRATLYRRSTNCAITSRRAA
jgi:putative ABC transport system substrate-binding protein